MNSQLEHLQVRPVTKTEAPRFLEWMQWHPYLGALTKIGHTLWYVATYGEHWVALLRFSAAAWKCGACDRWIDWDFRHRYGRLGLIANNSRLLILPYWHYPNLGSKTLALCQRRIAADWLAHFGKPLLLLETFVDPARYHGTVYRAANWLSLGQIQGYRRTREGYSRAHDQPKWVLVKSLRRDARDQLARPLLDSRFGTGAPKLMRSAEQMQALPDLFKAIPDPRRAQGRRYALPTVLAIAAGVLKSYTDHKTSIAEKMRQLGRNTRLVFDDLRMTENSTRHCAT